MKKTKKTPEDQRWLKELGVHIADLIKKQGFQSPYDFWVNAVGDQISRTTLNYILNGEVDVRVTTLRKIARALKVKQQDILGFKE